MKLLIHEEGLEGHDVTLAALFRAAERTKIDPFRKRRVLASLERTHGRGRRRFWLRPAFVGAVLVSGTAAASVGQRYVSHGAGFFGFGWSQIGLKAAAPTFAPPRATNAAPTTGSAPNSDTAGDPASPASEPTLNPAPPAGKGGSRAHPDQSAGAARMVEAIQALRTEGDPARAQGLLRDYLEAHPRGVLSEDALALSIEAASKLHDGRAADFSRRYLAQFPHGKYRDLASRALGLAD